MWLRENPEYAKNYQGRQGVRTELLEGRLMVAESNIHTSALLDMVAVESRMGVYDMMVCAGFVDCDCYAVYRGVAA